MKLFTVGPVEMYPETLEQSAIQLPYFRTSEFSKITLESEKILLDLCAAPADSRAVFLTASGTGAMEAAVINCLTPDDRAIVIDGGSFGHRFVQLCQCHNIPQNVIELPFGQRLTARDLDGAYSEDATALLVNIDETSIGQLYDIGLLLIVDAISSFLADRIEMEKDGVDVLIVSSQKALALAPGISAAVLSPKALDIVKRQKTKVMYLDFQDHLLNGERGQTPFTPAVGILLTLNTRLKSIKEQGLENVRASIAALARNFRDAVRSLPIEIPDYPLSNAVTPLYFPKGNAKSVYETLYNDYEITVTPSGGELANRLLRVGHMGNLTVEDNDRLLKALGEILS